MTIHRGKKLLFIHIPKNAGKSIEVALGMITERESRRYLFRSWANRCVTAVQRLTSDRLVKERLFGTLDVTLAAQHLTLQEILNLGLLDKQELPLYLKFAVVRNPWDRAISTFVHLTGSMGPVESFIRFWEQASETALRNHNVRAHLRTQASFLKDCDGETAVDHVLRFESLDRDFRSALSQFAGTSLPRIGGRKTRINYREYYNERARQLIANRFCSDIEQFKYRF